MNKRLRLLLPALLIAGRLYAQSGPDGPTGVVQSSASNSGGNANNEGGLSNLVSVNQYDGTANVNVPLYSYSIGGLDLGISLSYDTHGIKVDQVAGNVGLGWTLNAAGSITRETKGVEDEVEITTPADPRNPQGYSPLYLGSWFPSRNRYNSPDETEKERDLFRANFGGRSVSFEVFVDNSSNTIYQTNPISGLSIHAIVENSSLSPTYNALADHKHILDKSRDHDLLGFIIYDEYGNTFRFSRGDYQVRVINPSCTYYSPLNWNLTEVITKDGQHIVYTYGSMPVEYLSHHSEQVREVDEGVAHWNQPAGIFVTENKDDTFKGGVTYIEDIRFPDGVSLDFQYKEDQCSGEPLRPLDKIVVTRGYDNTFKNKKSFLFNYAFFHSPWKTYLNTEEPYKSCSDRNNYYSDPDVAEKNRQIKLGWRLKLKGIDIIGADNVTTEPYYSFLYNNSPLPRRLSAGKDYYGYYNGRSPQIIPTNPALSGLTVPLHMNTAFGVTYGTDKTPDFNKAKNGVLEKITNGGGASVLLTYKEHVLTNPASGYMGCTTPPAGGFPAYEYENASDGLCIDEVITKDGFSEDNTTKMKYEYSGGQRFFRGGFSWVPWAVDKGRIYYNNFITPMQFVNGSNHGYSYVEAKNYNYAGALLSSQKTHFTNLVLESNPAQSNLKMNPDKDYNFYPIDYFYSYRMGRTLDVSDFDHAGNEKSKVVYEYRDDFNPVAGLPYYSNMNKITEPKAVSYYNFYSFPFIVKKKTETDFTNNGAFVKTQEYTYTSRLDLKTTKWLDDNGNANTKEFKYAYERPNGSLFQHFSLTEQTTLTRTIAGANYIVDQTENLYEPDMVPGQVPGPFTKYLNAGSNRLANNALYSGSNSQSLNVKSAKYTKWDSKGNTIESEDEESETATSYIWDTRFGENIAKVGNARHDQIAYTSFEGSFETFGTADDSKGNWDFYPASITYVSANNADQPMTGHYYYDLGNQNAIVSKYPLYSGSKYQLTFWATSTPAISGSNILQLSEQLTIGNWKLYTVELTGNGQPLTISRNAGGPNSIHIDELRLHPFDAEMTTTTYEPLFGAGSMCDARSNIVYFEYDVMGRQTVTRDINRNILHVKRYVVAGSDNY